MAENTGQGQETGAVPVAETSRKKWDEHITAYAQLVRRTPDQINNALKDYVGEPSDEALAILADPSAVTDEDLKAVAKALSIPIGLFRANVGKLRGQVSAPVAQSNGSEAAASFDVLPPVPADESFLSMLQVGGQLKVDATEVVSVIKAGIAKRLGLYDMPKLLSERMREFAEEQQDQVGEEFYAMQNLLTSRNYADIMNAIGAKGHHVSQVDRNKLLERVDEKLWPAILSFHKALLSWYDSWTAGMSNPGMMMNIFMLQSSGVRAPMPPGMTQPPDTGVLRDVALGVNDVINKVFAGTGRATARALAYDATMITNALKDPKLPALVGATSRDQMLKSLRVAVGPDYIRLEQSVTRYVLSIFGYPAVSAGNAEYGYLGAMFQLGTQIQWDKLPGGEGAAQLRGQARPGRHERGFRNGEEISLLSRRDD